MRSYHGAGEYGTDRDARIRLARRPGVEGIDSMKRYQQFFLLALLMTAMESAGLAQLEKATARIDGDF